MPPEPLKIESVTGVKEGVTVLHLFGSLTLQGLPMLQHAAKESTQPIMILDLAGVPYMDSAGLGAVMNFHLSAMKHGRQLAVAAPQQRIAALMELTKVNTVLRIFPSVAEAEAAL